MPVNRHTTNTGRQFELKAMSQELHEAKSAVVALGDGRGFLVNSPRHRQVVVTAAPWLPFFPHGLEVGTYNERTGNLQTRFARLKSRKPKGAEFQ
jgi:hypothetical protein